MSGLAPIAGFVLAGGKSRRMGRDKATIELDGLPLVVRALTSLRTVASTVSIVGNRSDLAHFAPIVADRKGAGPLAGIHAALAATDTDWNFFLPVDLPLLPVSLLRWMAGRVALTGALATVPVVCDVPQPTVAIYHRSLLSGLDRSLDMGHLKTVSAVLAAATAGDPSTPAVDLFSVEALYAAGHFDHFPGNVPLRRWFENTNTPAELAACLSVPN